MSDHMHCRGLLLVAAALYCAGSADSAVAQAWVPEPGTVTTYLDYQLTKVKYHLFSVDAGEGHGNGADFGQIDARSIQLGLDYGVARNLALSASVAYVGASYDGVYPESALDDGRFHGSFQDVSLGMRYMLSLHRFAITPTVSAAFPTHEYEHHGHVAVGKGNSSFSAGLAVGRSLSPWVSNVYLHGSYTRDFVRDVEPWGLDVNRFSGSIGWFVRPQLSASGYYTYLATENGIDWAFADPGDPEVEHNHDRAAQSVAHRVGGTLNYQLSASKGLFLDIGGIVEGENTHDGMSYTIGTNLSFLGPAFH